MPARRSISLIPSTRYCLLKGPNVRENSGWEASRGNRVRSVLRARTGQIGEDGEAARIMETPWWNGSVLDDGRVSLISFGPRTAWRRARYMPEGLSHVNSPDPRNPANAIYNAALRLIPS